MIGIVIADEGVKSIGALPIIREIQKQHGKIDHFFGAGGGAILAVLIAMGKSDEEIQHIFADLFDKEAIFNLSYSAVLQTIGINPFGSSFKKAAICKSDKILKKYQTTFGDHQLEDLRPHVIVQTTQQSDAKGKLIDKGPLVDVLYASNAMYPLMAPMELEGELCVSGVYSDSFPIKAALPYSFDRLVGITFSPPHFGENECYFEYWMHRFDHALVVKDLDYFKNHVKQESSQWTIFNVEFEKGISLWDVSSIPYVLSKGAQVKGQGT